MKLNSPWLGKEHKEVHEITLPLNGSLWVMIPKQSPSLSKIAALKNDELLFAKNNISELKAWLQTTGFSLTDPIEFRLISHQAHMPALLALAKTASLKLGKEVALEPSTCTIQFIPSEGRIRIPVQTVKSAKTKVLVVDDSDTIRKLLQKIIDSDPELECVGTVEHPHKAEEAILKLKPDVITMDIHMPEMTGVELVKKIVPRYQIPIIMISSLSMEDGNDVLEALESGAVDYIQKPSMNELPVVAPLIREKIKSVSHAKVSALPTKKATPTPLSTTALNLDFHYLIAIGSSTGGTEALRQVLTSLPEKIPPILIVQHIPALFSKAFAERMNELCSFKVKEAEDGEMVKLSHVYIAPGGKQMKIKKLGSDFKILIDDSEPVNRHKPSVDYLFDSIAAVKHNKVAAAILTGMGADGAKGLLKLRQQGARTLAQDEASSIVYGMPREAAKLGGAEVIAPLNEIADELLIFCSQKQKKLSA